MLASIAGTSIRRRAIAGRDRRINPAAKSDQLANPQIDAGAYLR